MTAASMPQETRVPWACHHALAVFLTAELVRTLAQKLAAAAADAAQLKEQHEQKGPW